MVGYKGGLPVENVCRQLAMTTRRWTDDGRRAGGVKCEAGAPGGPCPTPQHAVRHALGSCTVSVSCVGLTTCQDPPVSLLYRALWCRSAETETEHVMPYNSCPSQHFSRAKLCCGLALTSYPCYSLLYVAVTARKECSCTSSLPGELATLATLRAQRLFCQISDLNYFKVT